MKIYYLKFTIYRYIYIMEYIPNNWNHCSIEKHIPSIIWVISINYPSCHHTYKKKKQIIFTVHRFLSYKFHTLTYNMKPNLLFIYKAIKYTCQDDYKNYNTIRMTNVPSNNEKHFSSITSILKYQIPMFMSSWELER